MKNFFKKYGESIIRIFFLTFFMTAIVTYWKVGYNSNYFFNWMRTWLMVALIAYIGMCFFIRPFILDYFKLEGFKRKLVGVFILIFIFTFVFSYRFDVMTINSINIKILIKNFLILTAIVLPVFGILAQPIAIYLNNKINK